MCGATTELTAGSSEKHSYSNALLISAMSTVCIALLVTLLCFWGWFLYNKYGNHKPNLAKVEGAEGILPSFALSIFVALMGSLKPNVEDMILSHTQHLSKA